MPTTKRLLATALPTTAGLLFAAALLAALGAAARPATAAPLSSGIRYVAPAGSDAANDCTIQGMPCQTIQWALDQAQANDEIRVATGVYTSAGGTVASITQTVALHGGWNNSFTLNDPASQPTILDGQGLQPVVVISPTAPPVGAQITPTIEGLVVIHGQGQSAYCGAGVQSPGDDQCGGGVASLYADPLILNNVISDNIGGNFTFGLGGGLYLYSAGSAAVISGNLVYSNIANIGGTGLGGGIAEYSSEAAIQGNTIARNHDSLAGSSNGAGIKLLFSHASIIGNDIRENGSVNRGGGIHVSDNNGTVVISGNTILSNTAAIAAGGVQITGNGLGALIVSNTIAYNRALSPSAGRGGGIRVSGVDTDVTIRHNDLYANVAAWGGGSAIDLVGPGVVDGNSLRQNQNGQWGAALVLTGTTLPMTATNNVIADNLGGGIEAGNFGASAWIVNNTVVGSRNALSGAAGSGIQVYFNLTPSLPVTATIVNNLVLNSAACGIDAHNTLAVISHHNDVSNTNNYCGSASSAGNLSFDPLFVSAGSGDYHLSRISPAINAGSNAEAPGGDKDGVSRPVGVWVDIGAYESLFGLRLYLPLVAR